MKNILLLALALLFTKQSNAQFLKKLKSKIKEKVEEVVSEKGNKDNDENHPEEYEYEQENKSNKNDTTVYKDLKQNSTDAYSEIAFKDRVYKFDTKVTYSIKNNKSTTGLKMMNYYNSKNPNYFGTESLIQVRGKSFSIYDDEIVVDLIESKGLKIKDIYKESEMDEEDAELNLKIKEDLKSTGKTKTILGFSCKEYKLKSNNGTKYSLWITNDLNIKDLRLKKGNIEGFLLEIEYKAKHYTTIVKVIHIDKFYRKKIYTADYKGMSNMSPSEMKKIYGR